MVTISKFLSRFRNSARHASLNRSGRGNRRGWLRIVGTIISASALLLIVLFWFLFRPNLSGSRNIPNGWGRWLVDSYKGEAAQPKPLEGDTIPTHPFLASTSSSNMHVDAFASDVHTIGGPLGIKPVLNSYAHGRIGGECATVTFDSRGNIVAVCATFRKFSLLVISPDSLRPIAELALPPRASNRSLNLRKIMLDTSGGAYFFLDDRDRAVLVDAAQRLRIISQQWSGETVTLVVDQEFDLTPTLRQYTSADDAVTAVLPDWEGRYWFISRQGIVGTVHPETGKVSAIRLNGEEIQNSFAVDQHGVFVVSDYALYGLSADSLSGMPIVRWREAYQRASAPKLGSINLGSGTTPTLLGSEYVAIADNADPQVNVLVYKREFEVTEGRLVCKLPVFPPGQSATENSFIGLGRSLIIENNSGYDLFVNMIGGRTGVGGMVRVDVAESGHGCELRWSNPIISQTTVAKLSKQTGLVYAYAKDPSVGWGVDAYYLTGIDFETGETVFQQLTGTGMAYDNNWAPITLGPNGCAYVGTLRGLVQICDQT